MKEELSFDMAKGMLRIKIMQFHTTRYSVWKWYVLNQETSCKMGLKFALFES